MFDLLQSHLQSVKKEIEKYSQSIPILADYSFSYSQRLQDTIQHPQYVISIAGSAKSGKSTFLNALLGEDFIPNGATLRQVTGTSIVFADHDNQVRKQWNNGKVEVIQGNPLANAFHQEVKNSSWNTSSIEEFQYIVHRKLCALSSYEPHENIDFVIIDTPSVTVEMGEEQTLSFFKAAMEQTDLLFYVYDAGNPEEEQTLRLIQELRPDLLKNAVFIVNKVDQQTTLHIDTKASMQDISNQLQSYGIHNPRLYPVSAKIALYTRMIQKEKSHSEFYWKELNSLISLKEIENKENQKLLFQSLLEKSGVMTIEQNILMPIFIHVKEVIRTSLQNSIAHQMEQLDKDFEKHIQILSRKAEQKQLEKSGKEEHLQRLTSLINEQQRIIGSLKEQVLQTAALLKKDESMRSCALRMSSYSGELKNEGFESKNEAFDEASKLLELWVKKDVDTIPGRVSSFYNSSLQYKDTLENYFHLITDVAKKELARVNQILYEYGLTYPKTIDFIADMEQVPPRQMEIRGKQEINQNMNMYIDKIITESYEISYKDKVLLVFHKTKYAEKYKYDIEEAVRFAENDLNEKISNFSEVYYEEYLLEKYENYPKRVVRSANNVIERSLQEIELLKNQIKEDMKKMDEESQQLQAEIALINELQHRINDRSKLITAAERTTVNEEESIALLIDQAKTGTTFLLGEGEFVLQVSSLPKSVAFVGKGKDKTKIVVKGSISNSSKHDSFLFENLTIAFEQTGEDAAIKIDGYAFMAESCSFIVKTKPQTILQISGNTEGSITGCSFSSGLTAVSSNTNGVFSISASDFVNNETAIMLAGSTHTSIFGNFFTDNMYTAIDCKEYSDVHIADNRFSNHPQYSIICCDQAKSNIEKNEFTATKVCTIMLTDAAQAMITENNIYKNKAGVMFKKFAKATLTGNRMIENENGVLAYNHSELSLLQNIIKENVENGLVIKDMVEIPVCKKNKFLRNKGNGFTIDGTASGKIEDNEFDSNQDNGVMLSGKAELWAVNNTFLHHTFAGVFCEGSSHLIMVQNKVDGNGNGVQLKDKANVEIENNTFTNNKRYGMHISDSITGIVNENEFLENGLSAFWVDTAKEMEFTNNKQVESGLVMLKPQYWNSKMKIQRSNQKIRRLRQNKQTDKQAPM